MVLYVFSNTINANTVYITLGCFQLFAPLARFDILFCPADIVYVKSNMADIR